jgi:integrating conjugative element protein (TIGR03749 family)
MRRFKWLLILALISTTTFAANTEHVVWDKTPIHLTLPLNQERLVRFPQAVHVIENEAGDKVSVLKVQDAIYLKAREPLNNQRLLLQLMPQGEVIILSLSADDKITITEPVEVLLEKTDSTPQTPEVKNNPDLNAITLTRFAIQSLYAPERLLVVPAGVSRTPMQTRRNIHLMYGATVSAHPLLSWHGGDFYVTAVELENQLKQEVILDPRQILGNWQTATFYPTNTLTGRGHSHNTTTVFLVSDRPFNEALQGSREFIR